VPRLGSPYQTSGKFLNLKTSQLRMATALNNFHQGTETIHMENWSRLSYFQYTQKIMGDHGLQVAQ